MTGVFKMRNRFLTALFIILAINLIMQASLFAGDYPAPDNDRLRLLILQPHRDFSMFEDESLATGLMVLIDEEDSEFRDRIVKASLIELAKTEDERAVQYMIDYMDEFPLNALVGLEHFSTPESVEALLGHIGDEDEFTRRFASQSLGMLDYTGSDDMCDLKQVVLSALKEMLSTEDADWLWEHIEKAIASVSSQVRVDPGSIISN